MIIARTFALVIAASLIACGAGTSSTGSGAAADCGAKKVVRSEGASCTPATVSGICASDLGYHSATLETVCAVAPDGTLYLVDVNGDTSLSGTGWTYGPRAFGPEGENVYPVERDSLSAADESRCQSAQLRCSRLADAGAGDAGARTRDAGDAMTD